MDEYQREDLIRKVEFEEGKRSKVLADLEIPRSTYYKWRKTYDEDGLPGLAKAKPSAKRIWNKLTDKERDSWLRSKSDFKMGAVSEYDHNSYDSILRWMYHVAGDLRGKSVLEIGSNVSSVLAALGEYGGVDVVGTELQKPFVDFVNNIGGVVMVQADFQKSLPEALKDRTFEITFSRLIMDYFKPNKQFYQNVWDLTAPGGWSFHIVRDGFPKEMEREFKRVGFEIVEGPDYGAGGDNNNYYILLHKPEGSKASFAGVAITPALQKTIETSKTNRAIQSSA